ncbi:MAG: hypothetical protein RLZZ127_11, partial [Planctomycetota bacterium]
MSFAFRRIVSSAALAAGLAALPAADEAFTIIDLGPASTAALTTEARAAAINNHGDVVGETSVSGQPRSQPNGYIYTWPSYTDITVMDGGQLAMLVGTKGQILLSSDAGLTWTPQDVVDVERRFGNRFTQRFLAADLADLVARGSNSNRSRLGIAVGTDNAIYRVVDPGLAGQAWDGPLPVTWNSLNDQALRPALRGVAIGVDGTDGTVTCVAVGDAGVILRSENDGSTWAQVSTVPGAVNLADVVALPRLISDSQGQPFLACGADGALWRSRDSGRTWTSIGGLPAAVAGGVWFRMTSPFIGVDGESILYAVGSSGRVLRYVRTPAGAESWTLLPAPTGLALRSASLIPGVDNGLIVVGSNGQVHRTLNADALASDGVTSTANWTTGWSLAGADGAVALHGVMATGTDSVIVAGDDGVVRRGTAVGSMVWSATAPAGITPDPDAWAGVRKVEESLASVQEGLTVLGALTDAKTSRATAINDARTVIGQSHNTDAERKWRGFTSAADTLLKPGPLVEISDQTPYVGDRIDARQTNLLTLPLGMDRDLLPIGWQIYFWDQGSGAKSVNASRQVTIAAHFPDPSATSSATYLIDPINPIGTPSGLGRQMAVTGEILDTPEFLRVTWATGNLRVRSRTLASGLTDFQFPVPYPIPQDRFTTDAADLDLDADRLGTDGNPPTFNQAGAIRAETVQFNTDVGNDDSIWTGTTQANSIYDLSVGTFPPTQVPPNANSLQAGWIGRALGGANLGFRPVAGVEIVNGRVFVDFNTDPDQQEIFDDANQQWNWFQPNPQLGSISAQPWDVGAGEPQASGTIDGTATNNFFIYNPPGQVPAVPDYLSEIRIGDLMVVNNNYLLVTGKGRSFIGGNPTTVPPTPPDDDVVLIFYQAVQGAVIPQSAAPSTLTLYRLAAQGNTPIVSRSVAEAADSYFLFPPGTDLGMIRTFSGDPLLAEGNGRNAGQSYAWAPSLDRTALSYNLGSAGTVWVGLHVDPLPGSQPVLNEPNYYLNQNIPPTYEGGIEGPDIEIQEYLTLSLDGSTQGSRSSTFVDISNAVRRVYVDPSRSANAMRFAWNPATPPGSAQSTAVQSISFFGFGPNSTRWIRQGPLGAYNHTGQAITDPAIAPTAESNTTVQWLNLPQPVVVPAIEDEPLLGNPETILTGLQATAPAASAGEQFANRFLVSRDPRAIFTPGFRILVVGGLNNGRTFTLTD